MPLSSPTFCKFFLKADTNQHLQSETNTPPSIVAIILAFVGVKMLVHELYHIPTWLSLTVIAIVLTASIGFSMKAERAEAADGIAVDSRHGDR